MRWLAPIWSVAAVAYGAFIARATFVIGGERAVTLFDDAMISMRYARNLVEAGVLAFNPGDPAVEGYTNFLWTLCMAVVHVVPLPERWVCLAIVLAGAVLLFATGHRALALARLGGASDTTSAIALAAILGCYGLVFWTLRGMEVGLLACLVATALVRLATMLERDEREDVLAVAVCAALAMLTRTDAVVFVVVWIAWCALVLRGRQRVRVVAILVAVVIATLAGHTAMRLAYYGDPLPNTYYLKLEGIELATRLARGGGALVHLLRLGWFVPVALAAIALASVEQRRVKLLLAGCVLAAGAYAIYVGGDAWEELDLPNRYLAPAVPPLLVLAALGIDAVVAHVPRARALALLLLGFAALQLVTPYSRIAIQAPALEPALMPQLRMVAAIAFALVLLRRVTPPAWLVAVLLVVATSGAAWVDWGRHNAAHVAIDEGRVRHGLAIRAATSEDATIATTPAGSIPYFARRRTLDLLGKSDAHIAHQPPRNPRFHPGHVKWDYAYSIGKLQPDLIDEIFTPPQAALVEPDKQALPGWGYTELVKDVYVHTDSTRVDRELLRRALESR